MKISVVTPSLNQCAYLKQAAESVLNQAGNFELEWIVVDGASTDGTVDFLKSIQDPRFQWISEKDAGQSSAINNGIAKATGDVVAWLNADDLYAPESLSTVASTFTDPNVQWLVGRCDIIDQNGNVIRKGVTRYKNRLLNRFSFKQLLRENCISQPAVFWRRSFGQSIGKLDESLHYTMDYDLWLRMAKVQQPIILDQVLAQFRFHSTSKSGKVSRKQFDEGFRVACRYAGDDRASRRAHRLHVMKIVWSYRVMKLLGI